MVKFKTYIVTAFYVKDEFHPMCDDFFFTSFDSAVKGVKILSQNDEIEHVMFFPEPELYEPDEYEPFYFFDLEYPDLFVG